MGIAEAYTNHDIPFLRLEGDQIQVKTLGRGVSQCENKQINEW